MSGSVRCRQCGHVLFAIEVADRVSSAVQATDVRRVAKASWRIGLSPYHRKAS